VLISDLPSLWLQQEDSRRRENASALSGTTARCATQEGGAVVDQQARNDLWPAVSLVAGDGVDPSTPRFSGVIAPRGHLRVRAFALLRAVLGEQQ